VDAKDTPDMTEIKRTLGVPDALTACHTAVVNGYLIEGHVPAADIDRLLAQKPRVAGLAVPGMPAGSPGMEGAGTQRYQVLTFDKSGKTTVFASH
jgi:Predicted metal-binding protein